MCLLSAFIVVACQVLYWLNQKLVHTVNSRFFMYMDTSYEYPSIFYLVFLVTNLLNNNG